MSTTEIRNHPLILPVYVPTFFIAIAGGLLVPILPLFLRDFNVGYGLIGIVLAGQAVGMLLTDIPSGAIVGRLGFRKSMIGGLGLAALSTFLVFMARSTSETLIYRLLTGAGYSVFAVARHAYIADRVEIQNRGKSIAIFGGVNRFGHFFGPALGGLLGSLLNLRIPFLFAGGLIFGALIVVIGSTPKDGNPKSKNYDSVRSYGFALFSIAHEHYKILTTVGAGQLLAQMVRTGRGVFIPLYGADVLGLGVGQIGWISTIASAIDMVLFYPVGMVMDRFGRKFAIVPSFLIQGIGLALIPLTGGFFSLMAVAGVIGFGNGLGSGTMMTLGADLSPEDSRGEFLGMWRLIGDSGYMLGPVVAGGVAGALALPAATWVIGGSGILASVFFFFLVPETVKKTIKKE